MRGSKPSRAYHTFGASRPRGRCVVDGCAAVLCVSSSARGKGTKGKVCDAHKKAAEVSADGLLARYCQQCVRLHLIEDFDGDRRACRKRLNRHRDRRARRRVHEMPALLVKQIGTSVLASTDQTSFCKQHASPGCESSRDDGGSAASCYREGSISEPSSPAQTTTESVPPPTTTLRHDETNAAVGGATCISGNLMIDDESDIAPPVLHGPKSDEWQGVVMAPLQLSHAAGFSLAVDSTWLSDSCRPCEPELMSPSGDFGEESLATSFLWQQMDMLISEPESAVAMSRSGSSFSGTADEQAACLNRPDGIIGYEQQSVSKASSALDKQCFTYIHDDSRDDELMEVLVSAVGSGYLASTAL